MRRKVTTHDYCFHYCSYKSKEVKNTDIREAFFTCSFVGDVRSHWRQTGGNGRGTPTSHLTHIFTITFRLAS